MAFQPIVDLSRGSVFAYEALVRGPVGEAASSVLPAIGPSNRYAFDQRCRVKAIELATHLGLAQTDALLSINFLPNAVYEPRACIRLTLAAAEACQLPQHKLMFEFTENEALDVAHVTKIITEYRSMGFKVALDDFGAGHSGLGLLTQIKPDIVKLDMQLIRGIDRHAARQAIMKHTLAMLADLDIMPICEGVETREEMAVLRDLGVRHMQGYLFSKPAFEAFPALQQDALRT